MAAGAGSTTMADKIYMTDPTKLSHESTVSLVGTDDKGRTFIRLKETIFHPQGGGQPADKGTIGDISVIDVQKAGSATIFEVNHYLEDDQSFPEGTVVSLVVNEETRKLHARLHSAGHLIASIVEEAFEELHAYKGDHTPGRAKVTFKTKEDHDTPDKGKVKTHLEEQLGEVIAAGGPTTVDITDGSRKVALGEHEAVPCGGTHVSDLEELEEVTIRKVKKQKKDIIVSYEVSGEK